MDIERSDRCNTRVRAFILECFQVKRSTILRSLLSFSLITLACELFGHEAKAQTPQPKVREETVFGEVKIGNTEKKTGDSYALGQEEAINFFESVEKGLTSAPGSIPQLSPNGLQYLTGVYLYCSSRAGACPFILESLLSAEQLRKQSNSPEVCSTMKSFWEAWVRNGFEERLSYLVPIGVTEVMNDFNATKRSRFIKCQENLGALQPEESKRNLALTRQLLGQLKERQLNVLLATGAHKSDKRGESSEAPEAPRSRR